MRLFTTAGRCFTGHGGYLGHHSSAVWWADALGALQAAAITVGLPFIIVLLVMCVSLYMGLRAESKGY